MRVRVHVRVHVRVRTLAYTYALSSVGRADLSRSRSHTRSASWKGTCVPCHTYTVSMRHTHHVTVYTL
jgi:hypothetical protein